MATGVWLSDEQHTVPSLLESRLDTDPDSEYLDVTGTKLSAADVERTASRLANALVELGLRQGDRVATLIENSPHALLAWWGAIRGGYVAVPINTYGRERVRRVLAVIDKWIDQGFLPAAPKRGGCERCEYLPVCGPYEELRVSGKPQTDLRELVEIRRLA